MRCSANLLFTGLVAACVLGVVAPHADAQHHHRRHGSRQRRAPHSAAIAAAMGDLHWGMTKQQLMDHFVQKVNQDYQKKFKKVTGAIEEDHLRREMRDAIKRVHDSYVEFGNDTSGWDVSFLRDEFTHNNGEAMIVIKDAQARNFYFLIHNKFWKWYRAFDSSVFAGATFDGFAKALEQKFGPAVERQGPLHEGAQPTRWLEWQDRDTRLRAVDNTTFYGFYCLVFEDKAMLSKIDKLRVHKRPARNNDNPLVDQVTTDDSANPDTHPNIVDQITGKNHPEP